MTLFIVSIDGPDFSGKTTIANLLVELLREKNVNKDIVFKRTVVPSNLITGFFTRILRNSGEFVSSEVFALCYALDHLHHYETEIKPMQNDKRKYVVIMERSLLSTYIYQSIIGNVNIEWMREINKFCGTKPDITFILKVRIEELMKRRELEKKEFDKFELSKHIEKQVEVYYNLPKDLEKEFHVEYVDANDKPLKIAERIAERIQKEINKLK